MPTTIPQLYSVSENEYKNILNIFKGLTIAGGVATAVGLVAIVTDHFLGPESSETIKTFASSGIPLLIGGGISLAYGAPNYFGNKSLNRQTGAQ